MTHTLKECADQSVMPDWPSARKALLVRLRSIGDTVLMTPCLAALKQWRPDIEITVLMEPLAAPLLEGHPMVDNLLVVGRSLRSRARLVARLRRERFDVAFNLHGGTTATLLARLSGARWTAGYSGYRHSRLLAARAPAPDRILGRAAVHSVEQQLALLGWSGVPWPARPKLSLPASEQALGSARRRLAALDRVDNFTGVPFAVVAPAAAFESKRWQAAGFAAVADHLADHLKDRSGIASVIIAGPGQEHIAREVARAARSGPQVITGLSLQELVALLGLAQVFVGNDSGPMHIAAALALPIVAVFGSSNPTVWRPWTDSPCAVVGGQEGDEFAIKRIPVGDVIAALDEVLELAPGANIAVDAGFESKTAK